MNIKTKIIKKLDLQYPFHNFFSTCYYEYKYNAKGCIYMLHRVGRHELERLSPNENMKVSLEFLEKLIRKYKTRGVSFFSLDDVAAFLRGEKKLNGHFVCFTFDDGYKDNYTNAYPIFKKHNVPFTVFVATDFPDHKAMLWWYELEDLLLSNSEYILGNGETICCETYEEKCKAFLHIRELILKLPQITFFDDYCKLLNLEKSNILEYVKKESMSWEDIKALADDPICTIGGHSITHPAFNVLTMDELKKEVLGGCERLEQNIGKRIRHFAYPFGSPNEIGIREHNFMKQSPFVTVSTTDPGIINSKTCLNKLPRVFLSDMCYQNKSMK